MGLETIKDLLLRENWRKFIDKAHLELEKSDLKIKFTSFKNDGSYAKAKCGKPAVNFVFAQDSSRTWVELEMKPRTSSGKKYSQVALYDYLRNSSSNLNNGLYKKITWNEEDIATSPRNLEGKDFRIKVYLNSNDEKEWIMLMVEFAKLFMPILGKYKN